MHPRRSVALLLALMSCTPPDRERAAAAPLPASALPPVEPSSCDLRVPAPIEVPDITELTRVGYTYVGATRVGANLRVELRVQVATTAVATFTEVVSTIVSPPFPSAVLDGVATFSRVDPGVTVTSDDTITLLVPASRIQNLAAWLTTSGFQHSFSGWEIPTFTDEVMFIDADADAAYVETLYLIDTRRALVFDSGASFLSEVDVGTILLTTPTYDHWPGLNPPAAPRFPEERWGCTTLIPLRVEEIVPGGGPLGGAPGQTLLVGPSGAAVSYNDFVRSASATSAYARTIDPGIDGPFDTWTDMSTELAEDNRACLSGAEIIDPETGDVDACKFTRERVRFDFELAPGVHIAGHAAWTGVDLDVTSTWRDGALTRAAFDFESTLETAINVHATQAVDLPRAELDLLDATATPLSLVLGPTQINVDLDLHAWVAAEGQMQAGGSFGAVRADTWSAHIEWTAAHGVTADGDHTVEHPPATPPRLDDATGASFEGAIGASFGITAEEAFSQSGLSASVSGEGYLGLHVDPTATPWWRVETGTRSDVDVTFDLADGLLGSWPLATTLAGGAADLLQDDGLAPPGPVGRDARRIQRIDWDTALGGTSSVFSMAPSTDGGILALGTTNAYPFYAYMLKLDADGQPVFGGRRLAGTPSVATVLGAPDGGMLIGQDNCTRVIRYDATGVKRFERTYTLEGTGSDACDLVLLDDYAGTPALAVIGTRVVDGRSQPTVGVLDLDTGDILSWRAYDAGVGSVATRGTLTPRGTLLLTGTTGVAAHPYTYADGVNPANGALVADVLPGGDANWGVSVNLSRFDEAVETDNGVILAAGDVPTYTYHPRHAVGLVGLTTAGTVLWATTYAEDIAASGSSCGYTSQCGGDTAFDGASGIVAIAGGGAVLTATTGLGSGVDSWLLRVTDDGEPQWFWTVDGQAADSIRGAYPLENGLWAWGSTDSLSGLDRQAWVAHVPLEGAIRQNDAWAFLDRSIPVEINDLRDTTHVYDYLPGGTPVGLTSREITATAASPSPYYTSYMGAISEDIGF